VLRFIENGPDIPDELLYAQDEGNVVFFCGAGVSMAHAKLSSFADLAQNVIDDLGASEESKAKRLFSTFKELNKDPHTRGQISADHIFSALVRSFDNKDINQSVARCLKPSKKPELTAHKTILQLSRLQGGQTRLITTNFDLLFEACDKKVKSVTRSSLPRIEFADNDWGIIHLHGKVIPDYSGPDEDGFVLSSSEFGDAYLAQGWARSFVKDVLERFVAVFIGYSADDPPVRYLLEGLQQHNNLSHKIYAFQNADEEAVAQWNEKGVEAVVYDFGEEDGHSYLWDSLHAWGVRTKNPTAWKNRLLAKARKGPAKLKPHERGMVAHLVKSKSGARAFSLVDPPIPAEWLCVFDHHIRIQQTDKKSHFHSDEELINPYQLYALDSDPPPSDRNEEYESQAKPSVWDAFALNSEDFDELEHYHLPAIRGGNSSGSSSLPTRLGYLANWFGKISYQRIAVWWAGRQVSINSQVLANVRRQLDQNEKKKVPVAIVRAWNTLFELSQYYDREEYQEYRLQDQIKLSGWNTFIVREYGRVSAPYLKRGTLYSDSIPRDNRKKISVSSLMSVDVSFPEGVFKIEVPDEFLAQAVNLLRQNLEYAVDLKQDFSYWLDLCAIEPEEDVQGQRHIRSYGLSGYTLYFVRLFRRLLEVDRDAAKREYRRWRDTDLIFARLRIWAAGLNDIATGDQYADEILALESEYFWNSKGQRDLLLSLRNRWGDIPDGKRKSIEKKILKGHPRYKGNPKEEHKKWSAHSRLNILFWLKGEGCEFSFNLENISAKLKSDAPEWKPEFSQSAAESHDGGGGLIRTDTDWSSLKSLPLSEILEEAEKKRSKDIRHLTEYAPFQGLCDDAPLRALGALKLELKSGEFTSRFWETFLSRESRKNDPYRLKCLTAGRFLQIPNNAFGNVLLTASRWFEDVGPELRERCPKLFDDVWEKFVEVLSQDGKSSGSALVRQEDRDIDWVGEAINSPSGNLAELHMTDPAKNGLTGGKGFSKAWLSKVDQLFSLPEDAHRYPMVIFAFNFSWFYYIDPKWTENNLLSILVNEDSDLSDSDAVWSGFMWGAKTPNADLYSKLKPHLLYMANKDLVQRKRHVQVLSGILLAGWASKDDAGERYVTDGELRSALLNAGDEFRSHALWHLEQWADDSETDWSKNLLPFLQNVWPKNKKVRTAKTSAKLCEIALNQTNNFPIISHEVSKLVSKVTGEHVFIPEIRKSSKDEDDKTNLAVKYPEEYLSLLYTILPDQPERWPYGADDVLSIIEQSKPKLSNDPRLIELKSRLNDI